MLDRDYPQMDPLIFRKAREPLARFGAKCLLTVSSIMYGAHTQYATVERLHQLANERTGELTSVAVLSRELPDPSTVSGLAKTALLFPADIAYRLGEQPSQLGAALATAGTVYTVHTAHLFRDNLTCRDDYFGVNWLKAREAHVLGAAVLGAEGSYLAAGQVAPMLSLLASMAAAGYAVGYYYELKDKVKRAVG